MQRCKECMWKLKNSVYSGADYTFTVLLFQDFQKQEDFNANIFLQNFKSLFWKIINKAMKCICMTFYVKEFDFVTVSSNCCNSVGTIIAWLITFSFWNLGTLGYILHAEILPFFFVASDYVLTHWKENISCICDLYYSTAFIRENNC
jgi:hypothetical protein